ncbi:MAG: Clp protease N-terminal domain-containing protein [Verrucomicrobiota bacterium]
MDWLKSAKEILKGTSRGPDFTPRARRVLLLARQEADRLHHDFIGTEHLLLGVIALGSGVSVNVMIQHGFTLDEVRTEVERHVEKGLEGIIPRSIPYTPRTKRVMAQAENEAKRFQHTYVGTEHLLLALLAESEGLAAKVFKNLGLDAAQAYAEITKELNPNL